MEKMIKVHGNSEMRIISPKNDCSYHYFFGYYDLQSYSSDDKKHLCNRVKFMDRLPNKDDVAELGYIDLDSGELTIFAETTAWNFQQGAMLQWYSDDEVVYNIRDNDEYRSVIHNIKTDAKRYADRAVANVSPDGKYGLSINFNRLFDFRPGYGYSDVKDHRYDVNQPDDDGVFLVDMVTGKSKLIVSYKDMNMPDDEKYVINHITFNTASDRFLFLNRNFQTEKKPWQTSLFTSDLGGNIRPILIDTMYSHYNWKNERQILGYCRVDGVYGMFLINDTELPNNIEQLIAPCFVKDIHCIYSPDRRYIIGDGYDNKYRPLYIYDTETGEDDVLYNSYTVTPKIVDIRCDLHARWNHKGNRVSFDSVHRDKREICEIII